MEADLSYYQGLNYVQSDDGLLPSGENQDFYDESNLVCVQISYSGEEVFGEKLYTGTVSLTELQSEYVYYKYYAIENGKVKIELIDNPFTNRPTGKGFNNWVSEDNTGTISFDSVYYKRYIEVDVAYDENGKPKDIAISLHASWIDAAVAQKDASNSWETVFNRLNNKGIKTLKTSSKYEGQSMAGYYISVGTSYRLIQSYDTDKIYNSSNTYYYMVTRDTNIVYLTANISDTWSSSESKPFIFTGLYGGVNYSNTYTWTVSSTSVQIYNDTTIENLKIASGTATAYTGTFPSPATSATQSGYLYGNYKNLKVGRGITSSSSTTCAFIGIIAGTTTTTGSSSNPTKYNTIIESGAYRYILLTNNTGAATVNVYVDLYATYGSDYDRAKGNNSNLSVSLVASGSWGGNIYSVDETYPGIKLTVKSGSFGTNTGTISDSPHTQGIYVGGRGAGTQYCARSAKIEGGYIYNLIGGPLSATTHGEVNDIYIYMTGGTVDSIVGGAGTSATYGNRILSLTGGTVNYNVFGGSNGYGGTTSTDGTLNGSSFIYVGGNCQIGNRTYVENNRTLWDAEAGSVFGIGNGRSGSSTVGSNDNSNIIIDGNAYVLGNVYGGGNYAAVASSGSASTTQTNIQMLSGTIDGDIYGGGNRNGSGLSTKLSTINITMTGGKVLGSVYGGSNITGTIYGTSNINIKSGNINTNVYGGGKGGYVSTSNTGTYVSQNVKVEIGSSSTSPTINGSVYGGSAFGSVNGTSNSTTVSSYTTNVTVNKGKITSVFGGGEGNSTYTPYVMGNLTVTINDGEIGYVYGGNDQAGSPNGTSPVYLKGGTIGEAYGGGNSSSIRSSTQIYLQGATTNSLFGGSNTTGTVPTSNVTITSGTVGTVFGGNNAGGQTNTANVTVNGGNVTNVYGGGRHANTGTTYVNLNSSDNTLDSVYGGGYSADVTTTNINVVGVDATDIFGGSNTNGTVTTSNITIYSQTYSGTIENIYGGNNAGGQTITTKVNIDDGNIGKVFGGGNQADVTSTNVQIKGGKIDNLYGGGNAAGVTNNTNLNVTAGLITTNVYGGGEEGIVYGNTYVNISNAEVRGSLYAGGNGPTATVWGNTNLNMHGNTIVGHEESKSPVSGCVFGGGNAAATGIDSINNSSSTVNITGGTIYGNVYGGANTSVVYGYAVVNIGYDAVQNNALIKSDIYIKGTIFGGGEANAEGSDDFDFDFISVKKGIDMNIDGSGHSEFKTEGSIFGSGNASSTEGESHIYIKNFGTAEDPQRNISIQRATVVTLDNSAMVLNGATDRTNDYADEYFSISRVDEVKLKNNSTLYLNYGANLLKKVSSLVDMGGVEKKAEVTIDEETGNTVKNVDNRIYLREGRNLNVATSQTLGAFGEVNGMTFLGLYASAYSPTGSTGPYHHSYENNDVIINEGTFSNNSYVRAMYKSDLDISVDGFYTNYNNNGYIKTGYIGVTEEGENVSYIWLVGENMDVTSFEITLTASKYSTLGTTELQLLGFGVPNTKFVLTGFSAGLQDEVSLVDKSAIPAIASTTDEADTVFGLGMKAGNIGWQTGNSTQFYTANGGSYSGSTAYNRDNSSFTPILSFYLYHSQNLSLERDLGEARIRFQVFTPIDDLNYKISWVDVNVIMRTALYQDYFYETAIAPGEEFELFTTTETNITNNSKFSSYFALYIDDFSNSKYSSNYFNCKHVLVSTHVDGTAYVFPEGTKITMIDKIQKKYYYYVVSNNDKASGKYKYNLSDFIEMGSSNEPFDEALANQLYYNSNQDIIYENFIFHVDFKETDVQQDIEDNILLMELQDQSNQTLVSVLGIQRDKTYSIYADKNSTINVSGTVSPNPLYLGDLLNLTLNTNYTQSIYNSKVIFDTKNFNYRMGIKLSIFDGNNNQLSGDSLLGVTFLLDGMTYYPRMDGTVRINVADKLSNVLSKITIDTTNNTTLPTGTYTIKVEAFGSPDGICYGEETPQYAEIEVNIINGNYGLKVWTDDNSKIIDKTTGQTLNKTNSLLANLEYTSVVLSDPNITVSLERRDYTTAYAMNYNKVDLQDYVTDNLREPVNEYEYKVSDIPEEFLLTLKENLMTGTYKLVFKLYDKDTYIGEAYEYLIIK